MPLEYYDSQGSTDHTLHFHALFTSSLALFYAFTSTGHKQAGINEWQKSNIYATARAPKAGHVTTGLCRDDFLPHSLQREVRSAASGRLDKEREDSVCCRNVQRQEEMQSGMVRCLLYLFLCAWRVDLESVVLFVHRNTSICYFAKHWTEPHAYSINCSFNYTVCGEQIFRESVDKLH